MTTEIQTNDHTRTEEEPSIKGSWRPWMAFIYMIICLFDFVIAPILTGMYFSAIQPEFIIPAGFNQTAALELIKSVQQVYVPWAPITLAAGGLFHMSMGAILGITSFTRGQEKVAKINHGVITKIPGKKK